MKKGEATLSNNARYCLTREKTFVATAESPVSDRPLGAWGIGTQSSKSPAYNPTGYHTGSVWSQDNALTALGWRSRSAASNQL
ncbi:hypothetical protein Q5692_36410 [Microcoleus sp. C2C3]|uniref:hypothetical protein n=1 Tax=unclassified Microcoleus TaxID=2642155 RepID=UPI002FCF5A97